MDDLFDLIGSILEGLAYVITSVYFWVWVLGVAMGAVVTKIVID